MPISLRRLPTLLLLVVLTGLAFSCAMPARAVTLEEVSATVMSPKWDWLVGLALIVLLLAASWALRAASRYASERLHASRVARLMDVMASQAAGIAAMLLAHPPGAGMAIQVVRQAMIAAGVAYVKANLPDTIKAIAVSDDTLAARLDNEVASKLLTVPFAAGVLAGVPAPTTELVSATPA